MGHSFLQFGSFGNFLYFTSPPFPSSTHTAFEPFLFLLSPGAPRARVICGLEPSHSFHQSIYPLEDDIISWGRRSNENEREEPVWSASHRGFIEDWRSAGGFPLSIPGPPSFLPRTQNSTLLGGGG